MRRSTGGARSTDVSATFTPSSTTRWITGRPPVCSWCRQAWGSKITGSGFSIDQIRIFVLELIKQLDNFDDNDFKVISWVYVVYFDSSPHPHYNYCILHNIYPEGYYSVLVWPELYETSIQDFFYNPDLKLCNCRTPGSDGAWCPTRVAAMRRTGPGKLSGRLDFLQFRVSQKYAGFKNIQKNVGLSVFFFRFFSEFSEYKQKYNAGFIFLKCLKMFNDMWSRLKAKPLVRNIYKDSLKRYIYEHVHNFHIFSTQTISSSSLYREILADTIYDKNKNNLALKNYLFRYSDQPNDYCTYGCQECDFTGNLLSQKITGVYIWHFDHIPIPSSPVRLFFRLRTKMPFIPVLIQFSHF